MQHEKGLTCFGGVAQVFCTCVCAWYACRICYICICILKFLSIKWNSVARKRVAVSVFFFFFALFEGKNLLIPACRLSANPGQAVLPAVHQTRYERPTTRLTIPFILRVLRWLNCVAKLQSCTCVCVCEPLTRNFGALFNSRRSLLPDSHPGYPWSPACSSCLSWGYPTQQPHK